MTDASFAADSAPVSTPADVGGAPVNVDAPSIPTPLGSQLPQPERPAEQRQDKPEEKKPAASAEEALRRADQKVRERTAQREAADKKPAEEKPDAEPKPDKQPAQAEKKVAAPEPHREQGRFAVDPAKQAEQAAQQPAQQTGVHREPPARFDDAAKREWANAPETVRGAVHRAISELEQGHQKYKADAEAFGELREFHEMARQSNTTIKQALTNYVGVEQLLRQDLVAGLERIVANVGLKLPDGRQATLQDVAARILGATPDENSARQNATIQQLHSEINQLKQQVGSVSQTVTQQREQAVLQHLNAFAETHPRLDELTPVIERLFAGGLVEPGNLEEAYRQAELLKPAAPGLQPTPLIPAEQSQPLKPAGQKSISGAPSGGVPTSTPRKPGDPIPSVDESLSRAFRKVRGAA